MNDIVDINKTEDEGPVPTAWRSTFYEIVQSMRNGDFSLKSGKRGVMPLSDLDASMIQKSILSYGSDLDALPQEAWDTSVYRWMETYWDVLIDLFTVNEGLSDLVLFVSVREDGDWYSFEVRSVHVP